MKIAVLSVLIGSFALSSSILIRLDGQITSRKQFCIGDNITFVCDEMSTSFAWRIPPQVRGTDLSVTTGIRENMASIFTARYISSNESTLEFIANEEINGSNITCVDTISNDDLASKEFALHALPVAPSIDFIQDNANLATFGIRIISNDSASICVDQYNVSVSGNNQSLFAMVPRDDSVVYDAYTLFNTAFQLCKAVYSVNVMAAIGGGEAIVMTTINFEALNVAITGTVEDYAIMLDVPGILEDCITSYAYTFENTSGMIAPNGSQIMLSVFNITDSPCDDTMFIPDLTIDPVILGQAQTSLRVDITCALPPTTPTSTTVSTVTFTTSGSASFRNGLWATSIGLLLTILSLLA